MIGNLYIAVASYFNRSPDYALVLNDPDSSLGFFDNGSGVWCKVAGQWVCQHLIWSGWYSKLLSGFGIRSEDLKRCWSFTITGMVKGKLPIQFFKPYGSLNKVFIIVSESSHHSLVSVVWFCQHKVSRIHKLTNSVQFMRTANVVELGCFIRLRLLRGSDFQTHLLSSRIQSVYHSSGSGELLQVLEKYSKSSAGG